MAIKIINPASTVDYVLKADRGSELPTTFALRPLTWEQCGEFTKASPFTPDIAQRIYAITKRAEDEGRDLSEDEEAEINALSPDGIDSAMQFNRQYALAVEHGVVEIRGLLDHRGAPMKCTPREFARCASPEMLGELAGEILNMSRLSGDDPKN